MTDSKKATAAITAVLAHLDAEQDAAAASITVPIPLELYYQLQWLCQQLNSIFHQAG